LPFAATAQVQPGIPVPVGERRMVRNFSTDSWNCQEAGSPARDYEFVTLGTQNRFADCLPTVRGLHFDERDSRFYWSPVTY